MVWNDSEVEVVLTMTLVNLGEVAIITREQWSKLKWNVFCGIQE